MHFCIVMVSIIIASLADMFIFDILNGFVMCPKILALINKCLYFS